MQKQLEAYLSQIQWRIDKVNGEYLELVAKQIKKIGKLSPSSIRRIEQMRIYGANSAKIKRELAKALKVSEKDIENILKKAVDEEYTSHDFDGIYRDRGTIPLAHNPSLQRYIQAVAQQTAETMLNFSNTTNLDVEYQEVVSDAVDAVSRGVVDYNSAIRSAMRKLGGDGLRVTYASGHTRRMDSAIRMNILDSVRQVSQKANEMNGKSIGADGVELSAHPYSALDHEPAQGRQFSLAEFENMQSGQSFQDIDGNQYAGFRRPIGQWNCHHNVRYIIIGISKRRYTDAQLKQWKEANHKGVEIDGRKYTVYQATQLMRKLETKVRQQKDIANMAKISGDDVLRREAQAKIRDLNKKYTEVAQAAGLKERRDKMEVASYKNTDIRIRKSLDKPKEHGILNVDTPAEGKRMPNSITASTTQNKIQNYILNSNNPRGKHKAEVFNSVLGYHYENWHILSDKIYDNLQTSVVSKFEHTEYGDRYSVPMRIYGERNKSMVIKTIWQVDNGANVPRLITITFDKRTIKENGHNV